jgi:hypothetical protein
MLDKQNKFFFNEFYKHNSVNKIIRIQLNQIRTFPEQSIIKNGYFMKVPSQRIYFFMTDDYLRSFLVVYLETRSAWNFRIASIEERRWNRRRIMTADI